MQLGFIGTGEITSSIVTCAPDFLSGDASAELDWPSFCIAKCPLVVRHGERFFKGAVTQTSDALLIIAPWTLRTAFR
jgi:hypothetical protein